jgi:hypothetical protein
MREQFTIRFHRRITASALAVFAIACGSESVSPPAPATLVAVGATDLSATVATAVSTPPTVKVFDLHGTPVAGVTVQFAVTAGGGSISRSSATTDAAGTATAGTWTLGTAAGINTLDASVTAIPTVRFVATAVPGAPATLAVSAGGNQSGAIGAAVATAPAVIVKDQYGNPVSGVAVSFAVVSGNGTLSGTAATTGADGIARVGGWTLGIATGAQQIRATAGTLTTTISATAVAPAGCVTTNYALGAEVSLNWEANDCTNASFANRLYDRLQFTTTTQQQIEATVGGPDGRALLLRNATTGHYVGLQPSAAFSPVTQNPMRLKYVLAPGTYVFEPHAPSGAAPVGYSFATSVGTAVDCEYIVFASTNVQFSDQVNADSCVGPFGGKEQWINLQLKTGTKVRITLSNTEFVPILVLRDDRLGPASPTLVSKVGNAVGETLVIEWTATFDTWHEVIVAPKTAELGRYTLRIEELP